MRTELYWDEASFRDPAGRVIIAKGDIFRVISATGWKSFKPVWESGILMAPALASVILPAELLSKDKSMELGLGEIIHDFQAEHTLRTRKLPLISYPYEWGFETLRAAALAHLQLHLSLLAQGFTLSDATAFNIQFEGASPLHIDTLSIIPLEEGAPWAGYGQFQRHFLNPLLLESQTGIGFGTWWRGIMDGLGSSDLLKMLPWKALIKPAVLTHVIPSALLDRKAQAQEKAMASRKPPKLSKSNFIALLKHLEVIIKNLNKPAGRHSVWEDYTSNNTYLDSERTEKLRVVGDFSARVQPTLLMDLGCNTGDYAEKALRSGAKRVIGLENDRGALDLAFLRAKARNLAFTPLAIDITNPSPAQGWNGRERSAFASRCQPDALIALAVIHHIVIRGNIPFRDAIRHLVGLAPRGIIEFVPKQDPQVIRMLRHREDIFTDYDQSVFMATLKGITRIVAITPITSTGRCLVEYERN